MIPAGSESARPLPAVPAVIVTALGVVAMFASGLLAARGGLSLGLRGQIALGTVLLAVPTLVTLLARPPAWRAALGSAPVRQRVAGLSTLLGATLWIGSLGLMEVQSLVSPPPPQYLESFRAIHRALAPAGPLDTLVSLAVIAVLPGLCEELVVRGALLPSLVRPLGSALAVGASALLFAAIHLDPYRFLFTFTVGFVFGVVRLATGSLWPPILAHLTLNALTFAIAPLVDDPSQPYTPQPALGLACLVAGVALTFPLLRALGRHAAPPA
ncbi:MAG TPA: type II CAAX endopeptidase family protein [Vicinamibacteria bacterium]|nr:type II CAAX endopeptidase family protein [Vicinamibacteria bacterium]